MVCDGMSGYRDNAAAARAAAKAFVEGWTGGGDVGPWLDEALIRAQSAVLDLAAREGVTPGVTGTTLLAAAAAGRKLWWISVGDTSLFLLRDGLCELLNVLHEHERRGGPRSYLGAPELREVDRSPAPVPLRDGDAVLLATDGLTMGMETDVGAMIATEGWSGVGDLVGGVLAMDRAGQDNLTVVLVRCSA